MAVSPVTPDDLEWATDALRRRREALIPHAPVFWRPAPDADVRHRACRGHLLIEAGARAWRTSTSVLIAERRGEGWLVDDLAVDAEDWPTDGRNLWNAFAAEGGGDDVRFVCPTYEVERARLAADAGLVVSESWWLRELDGPGGGEAGVGVELPGADAITVQAPPVYAPPGPVLFLPAPEDVSAAVPVALDRAPGLGCAAVVVNQSNDQAGAAALNEARFRRHCDFHEGVVRPI